VCFNVNKIGIKQCSCHMLCVCGLFHFEWRSWQYRIRPTVLHSPWKKEAKQGDLTNKFSDSEPNPEQVPTTRASSRCATRTLIAYFGGQPCQGCARFLVLMHPSLKL